MRGLIIRWGTRLAERFPITAGSVLILASLVIFRAALALGPQFQQFEGGARVEGEVVGVSDEPLREPRYAAEVTWNSEGRVPWEPVKNHALAEVPASQVPGPSARHPGRQLHPGAKLPIVISTKRPDMAISTELLEDNATLRLGTIQADAKAAFMGALCLVAGLLLLVPAVRRARVSRQNQVRRVR